MAPQEPQHSPSPNTGKSDTVILRSATPSERGLTEKLGKVLLTDPDHESLPSEGEDIDSGEALIFSRVMKDPNLLEQNGFEPIWVREFGYPGTLPPEIDEYLEGNGARRLAMVGSIRSIFWLFGYDDLVKVVDDPACVLEDEVVPVPGNINPIGYLVNYYSEQGKMPFFIQEVCDGVRLP